MAKEKYESLKNKVIIIGRELEQAKKAVKTYKGIVEDPDQSESERAKYKVEYEKAQKNLKDITKKYEDAKVNAEKLLGEVSLEIVKEKYDKLKERLDLQLDPNSESAQKIQAEINELVPEMQRALEKTTKVRPSSAVAKTKLLGNKIPTLAQGAEGESTGVAALGTPVPSAKTEKPAATPAATPATGTTPSKPAKKQPSSKTTATELARESGDLYGSVKADDVAAAARETAAEGIASSADFGLSEALFKNVPSLKAIYEKYIDPKSKMTDDEFRKQIRNDVWYRQNSKEIKNRFVQLYNYQDLKKTGQDATQTQYAKDIEIIKDKLRKNAVILGSDIASNPNDLEKIAEDLYITDRSEDDSFITDLLAARIRPVAGMLGGKGTANYSGQALQNYNALVKAARDNGFQVADIIPGASNVDQLLQNIAAGKIDINRVISDARTLASQGQPQYVRDLLAQGYNLNQVYAPYRQTMANILEIGDPDQIDLNDPVLRNAITDKGDMNLYDFKKELRKDNRWQYTENAKQEVSDAALGVLRDFGFQG